MKLCMLNDGAGPRLAAFRDGRYVDLAAVAPGLTVQNVISNGGSLAEQLAGAIESAPPIDVERFQLQPPISSPGKIICVGLNYIDHAKETGQPVPGEPLIFCKLPTTLIGPAQAIQLPSVSEQVDFEAELVVVIGSKGRHIPRGEAMSYVAGYMCGHDVSARDWQKGKPGAQWLLGKSFDTFAPTGPWFVSRDEISDPHQLPIQLRLNGQIMQESNTNNLIFPIDHLVSYLSQVFTLEPGDLIFTGTPPGVGVARKPPVFLRNGDVVEVEIEGLGCLRNTVERAT